MANYKVGKGKAWERYCMDALQVMYAAGVNQFTVGVFASWCGLRRSTSMSEFLDKLVKRGWLSVEPQELRDGRKQKVYLLKSTVWFGVKADA